MAEASCPTCGADQALCAVCGQGRREKEQLCHNCYESWSRFKKKALEVWARQRKAFLALPPEERAKVSTARARAAADKAAEARWRERIQRLNQEAGEPVLRDRERAV